MGLGVESFRGFAAEGYMSCLIDTHFLIWILTRSKRLKAFPWLDGYRPWGVSPFSLLEIQFLSEVGRLKVQNPVFTSTVMEDPRFRVDDVSLVSVVQKALSFDWTRDPFDRLLAAHSLVRRVPVCTIDRVLAARHGLIVPELRSDSEPRA
jgi:PIN domain nuclease of toxin-antitoxin system